MKWIPCFGRCFHGATYYNVGYVFTSTSPLKKYFLCQFSKKVCKKLYLASLRGTAILYVCVILFIITCQVKFRTETVNLAFFLVTNFSITGNSINRWVTTYFLNCLILRSYVDFLILGTVKQNPNPACNYSIEILTWILPNLTDEALNTTSPFIYLKRSWFVS